MTLQNSDNSSFMYKMKSIKWQDSAWPLFQSEELEFRF